MIQVRGLTKYYGDRAAIANLDFDIARGEVIGFLGRNGAGKTTTLKILSCVLLPTSGTATVDGVDVVQDAHAVRARIGFLPDTPPLYNEMTVGGYLRFAAELRGVPRAEVAARVGEAEEKAALTEVHDAPIASLSHGFRQRVGLAQAIVHRPALLILDEPTAGLDPIQIVEMRGLIRKLRGEQTVLISSHILAEISQTCDRLLVIQDGEIVAQGREDELASKLGHGHAVELTVLGTPETLRGLLERVDGVTGVTVLDAGDGAAGPGGAPELRLRVDCARELRAELARALVAANVPLLRLDRATSRLESVFLQLARTAPAAASASEEAPS